MNSFYQSAERVLSEEHPLKDLLVAIIIKCSSKTNDLDFAIRAWEKLRKEKPTIEDLCDASRTKEMSLREEIWKEIIYRLNKLDESLQFGYLVYILKFVDPLERNSWIEISKFISNEKTPEEKILDLIFIGEQVEGLDKKIWIQEESWSWIKKLWKNLPEEIADYITAYGQKTEFFKRMTKREFEDFLPQTLFRIYLN